MHNVVDAVGRANHTLIKREDSMVFLGRDCVQCIALFNDDGEQTWWDVTTWDGECCVAFVTSTINQPQKNSPSGLDKMPSGA
jgi:hypothetical protein